jgi:predicted nuclease of predicted toxin-antitoxin system
MKLLFDENLSFKLRAKMQDAFPGSKHVCDLGLEQANDIEIWEFSKRENFVIVTKDADFNDLSVMLGYPPHIVWLRTGNTRVSQVENILRSYQERIEKSVGEGTFGIVEIKGL